MLHCGQPGTFRSWLLFFGRIRTRNSEYVPNKHLEGNFLPFPADRALVLSLLTSE